jgi:hypothetical protein
LAFPGQWDFGLKSVAKCMTDYAPEFPVEWPEEMSGGGMAAMLLGCQMYQSSSDPLDSPERVLLSKYLQTDVYSMARLLDWITGVAEDVEAPKRKVSVAQHGTERMNWWTHAQMIGRG